MTYFISTTVVVIVLSLTTPAAAGNNSSSPSQRQQQHQQQSHQATNAASSADAAEVVQSLLSQRMDLQKEVDQLREEVTGLRKKTTSLESDKAHLMDTLRGVLRENAKFQQEIVGYQQEATKLRKISPQLPTPAPQPRHATTAQEKEDTTAMMGMMRAITTYVARTGSAEEDPGPGVVPPSATRAGRSPAASQQSAAPPAFTLATPPEPPAPAAAATPALRTSSAPTKDESPRPSTATEGGRGATLHQGSTLLSRWLMGDNAAGGPGADAGPSAVAPVAGAAQQLAEQTDESDAVEELLKKAEGKLKDE